MQQAKRPQTKAARAQHITRSKHLHPPQKTQKAQIDLSLLELFKEISQQCSDKKKATAPSIRTRLPKPSLFPKRPL